MSQNKSLHNDVCTYFILNGISIENERHRGGFMFFFVAEKFCNNTPTSFFFFGFLVQTVMLSPRIILQSSNFFRRHTVTTFRLLE